MLQPTSARRCFAEAEAPDLVFNMHGFDPRVNADPSTSLVKRRRQNAFLRHGGDPHPCPLLELFEKYRAIDSGPLEGFKICTSVLEAYTVGLSQIIGSDQKFQILPALRFSPLYRAAVQQDAELPS